MNVFTGTYNKNKLLKSGKIVIFNPETWLHPKNQIEWVEQLAHNNLDDLIITTNSPYILKAITQILDSAKKLIFYTHNGKDVTNNHNKVFKEFYEPMEELF